MIKSLNEQIEQLKKGKKTVDKFILQPNLIVMQLESKVARLTKLLNAKISEAETLAL